MASYLDYQSAKPVDPRVTEAMLPYLTQKYGNPSALHTIGDQATEALESCRATVAHFFNASPKEIIFTSGATESNNAALIGFAMRNKNKGNHIVMSEIEHISIHNIAKYLTRHGFTVTKIPVDQYGRVNPQKAEERLTDKTILVSVAYANNEIGTIQPIGAIGKLCRARGIALHTDAVAAEGLLHIDVNKDSTDMMTVSSNDLYGPKGVGILYIRDTVRITPINIGGGQERGLRSGTENLAGIVGMAKAADIMNQEMDVEIPRFKTYRDRLIEDVLATIPRTFLNGHRTDRLPNNAHFRFDGIEGESLLLSLNDKDIAVSTGSACSSKTLEASHTLIALGLLHEEAHGSLQLTVGRFTQEEDIDAVLSALPDIVARLRELSPLYTEEV